MFTAQKKQTDREKYFVATQWQLMRRKFAKHRIAVFGGVLLALFYVVGLASEFLSPYGPQTTSQYLFCPPRRVHLLDATGKLFHVRPFVYGIKQAEDPETWQRIYTEDKDSVYPIRFFARGESYKFWGLFPQISISSGFRSRASYSSLVRMSWVGIFLPATSMLSASHFR